MNDLTPEELRDRWLRAEAELENTRRRQSQAIHDAVAAAEADVLRRVLPIADDLNRAVEAAHTAKGRGALKSVRDGVGLLAQKARATLEGLGVEPIDAQGQPFEPATMEAIQTVSCDAEDGTVVQQYSGGYRRNGRLLQPAKVVVSRKKVS